MWTFVLVAGLVIICIMAFGGSVGARRFLVAIGALALILGVVVFGYVHIQDQKEARRESARKTREAACQTSEVSECLYREIRGARSGIAFTLDRLRTISGHMNPSGTKIIVDSFLQSDGYFTVSDDSLHKLLVYQLRPKCPGEKRFYFQVEFSFSTDENSLSRIVTWWHGAEASDEYFRPWNSCVTKPEHVGVNGYDSKLSIDYTQLPRPVHAVAPQLGSAPSVGKPTAPPVKTRKVAPSTTLSEDNDPCAVGVSVEERLKRLRKYGSVRQTGSNEYSAGSHVVVLDYKGKDLIYCH